MINVPTRQIYSAMPFRHYASLLMTATSGIIPSLHSGIAKIARSVVTINGELREIPAPPPMTNPFQIETWIGFMAASWKFSEYYSCVTPSRKSLASCFGISEYILTSVCTSSPQENDYGVPWKITILVILSSFHRATCYVSSIIIAGVSAFNFSTFLKITSV